jgi:glycosyltransferase involved in cell wall biosynthesis
MSVALISVVIPVHNGAAWLPQTLDSIFSQTYQIFEIILVNDASTDDLLGVLAPYSDLRLRVEHLSTNVGVSAARNHGIRLAQGQFIAFCDADDICQPERLARQLAFLERNPDISMCGSAFTCFSEAGDQGTITHPLTNESIQRGLMQGNCFGLSTVMARTSVLQKHMFNSSLRVAEDYDLWTRIAASGLGLANVPESLVRYRLHAAQASDTHSTELDQMTRKLRALYCAHLLNSQELLASIESEDIHFEALQLATKQIEAQSRYPATEFRFMLAWMYQKLPSHGVWMWYRWVKIQRQLNLNLNFNYAFNVAVLACLPRFLSAKCFPTLIKLKI